MLDQFTYLFQVVDCRVQFPRGIDVAPVQVDSCQVASRATVDDSIDVEHRDDLKHEVVSEDLGVQ